jgi:hypothetical protein
MTLVSLWKEQRDQLKNKNIQQIIKFSKSQIEERDVKEQKKLSHRFSQLYGSRI